MNKKFRRCFVPHYNFRFSTEPLLRIADSIVYVCETPMFDDLVGMENKPKFEEKINMTMGDFDPQQDIIAFYGDAIIFAMMVAKALEINDEVTLARYSSKREEYVLRSICANDFC